MDKPALREFNTNAVNSATPILVAILAVQFKAVLVSNAHNEAAWSAVLGRVRERRMAKSAAKKRAEAAPEEESKVPTGVLVRLMVAAWLVPGGGHFLQGRKGRALILFGSIISMFIMGVVMNGEFFRLNSPSILQRLGFVGEWSVGAAMAVAHFFGYSGDDPFFASADYGSAFLVAAGMLNILTMFDAYDIAMGRKK